jgi:hypothetical protein
MARIGQDVAMHPRTTLATIVTSLLLGFGVLTAPVASADVLVESTASRGCVGHSFPVGVWYQSFSGGSRGYRVSVYAPNENRICFRHGKAPSSHWLIWHIPMRHTGRYITVYRSGPHASTPWRSRYHTTAERC